MLHNRISAQDYKESQDDVLAVSGVVEDIRDALLDYQVGDDGVYTVIVSLKPGRFNRWPNNGRCMTGIAS